MEGWTLKDWFPVGTVIIALIGAIFYFGDLNQRVSANENKVNEVSSSMHRIEDSVNWIVRQMVIEGNN